MLESGSDLDSEKRGGEGDRTRPGQSYPEIWKQETGSESLLVSLRLGRSEMISGYQ